MKNLIILLATTLLATSCIKEKNSISTVPVKETTPPKLSMALSGNRDIYDRVEASVSGANGMEVTWNMGDGTQVTNSDSTFVYRYKSPGTYSVTISSGGTIISDNIVITEGLHRLEQASKWTITSETKYMSNEVMRDTTNDVVIDLSFLDEETIEVLRHKDFISQNLKLFKNTEKSTIQSMVFNSTHFAHAFTLFASYDYDVEKVEKGAILKLYFDYTVPGTDSKGDYQTRMLGSTVITIK